VTLPAARRRLHYTLAVVWLVFMVSLASWWLILGLRLTNRHRMFEWEGATFITLLVAGGLTIVLAIRREHRRRQVLETFFMSFTHDLKTALASIQLQAEGLREDGPDGPSSAPLDRLLHDTVRLQIQLENSLFVAQPDGRLLREHIDVAPALARLAQDWPELTVDVQGQARVLADARAFDTVFRNLLQNAVVHGAATAVTVRVERPAGPMVRLVVGDNGRGLAADRFAHLGEPFARISTTSGTGVGLFVCRQIIGRLGGALRFVGPARPGGGLTVVIDLPGER
jgi:signal transduction histidine kinase